MNITFSGKNDVRSTALEELCEKKLQKIEKKLPNNNLSAEINFGMEGREFVLSMNLNVDGDKFFAKNKGLEMYANIDACISKLSAQINKLKISKKGNKKPEFDIEPKQEEEKNTTFEKMLEDYLD